MDGTSPRLVAKVKVRFDASGSVAISGVEQVFAIESVWLSVAKE